MTKVIYNNLEYDIKDYQYPSDLDDPKYGYHKVIFFINVVSKSKFRVNNQFYSDSYDISEEKQNKRRTETTRAASTAQPVLKTADELANKVGIELNAEPSSISRRLKAAIALYIPNSVNFTYGVQWGIEDMTEAEQNLDILNDLVAGQLAGAATGIGRKMLSGIRNNAAVQSATRQTPGNAKEEQLFKSVDFRTFSFNYTFSPKNSEESKNVINIIRMFRHHMLPEFKDTDNFLFIYPSEFEIKYYFKGEENKNLEKHFTAVLENCSIDYTPNGQFSTFSDGMPTQINMSLTFKELSIPTKESSPYNESGT